MTRASSHQVLQSMESSSLGMNSSVPLPDGTPQRHSATDTQRPSCNNCPSGHRQPEKVEKQSKHQEMLPTDPTIEEHFVLPFASEVKDYLGGRLLGDTARAPISRRSCVDIDWHSCLGKSALYPRSARLEKKSKSTSPTL